MTRASLVAVVAVVAAFLGAAAALGIARAGGWVGGGETVVVPAPAGAARERSAEVVSADAGKPLPGNGFDPAAIYRSRANGVVTLIALFGTHSENGQGDAAQGSGFLVSSTGYILTNSHVITTAGSDPTDTTPEPASTIYVEFRDGDRVPAKVVGWDIYDDVGLIRVDPSIHPVSPVPLGDSSTVRVGQPIAAIGSPFGQMSSLSVGVVSATQRSIDSLTSGYDLVDAIQTDAPINRGNSGGPMLDARGRVVGINAQIRSESGNAEGVGFAVPINSAKRSMAQLIATGKVRYAWVGISTQSLTPSLARRFGYPSRRGAAVQSVVPDSPADAAGLRGGGKEVEFEGVGFQPGGDLIVAIDGRPVATAEDVVRMIAERLLPGQTTRLTVLRGGKRLVVPVKLTERPAKPPASR